jgi:hypothetical protein
MMKIINANVAGNILLICLALLAAFHVFVIIGIVPSDIIWGGQIDDPHSNLFTLEIIALFVLVLFAIIISAKMGYIKANKFRKPTTIGVWIVFAYFVLNTIGNLASDVSFENLIFAPITILMALCSLRLAIEK